MDFSFKQTDGRDPDFAFLCQRLDEDLDALVGKAFQRSVYTPYNTRDAIHDVLVAYCGGAAVACGGLRAFDAGRVELKRVYVSPQYRGTGLAAELVHRLEDLARVRGWQSCILETGVELKAACRLYTRLGYRVIPNYGPYVGLSHSVCMGRKL